MSRLIRRLFDHATRPIHPRRSDRPRTAAALKARLLLWPLEDRTVPTTFTVNSLTDTGTGSGTTGDLRYCITQSNATTGPNTINLTPTGTITLTSVLPAISQATTMVGPGGSALTIDANYTGSVFIVASLNFEMDNLTITHGRNQFGYGGGIDSSQSGVSITVKNSVITGNTAGGGSYGGGGIYIGFGGSLNVQNSSIVNNSAAANGGGGGIYFWGAASSFTISNSAIANNTAHNGGGLWLSNFSGTANIAGTTITGNTATAVTAGPSYGGGGITLRSGSGSVNLDNVIVSGNTATNGNNEFAVSGVVAAKYSALGSTVGIGTYTNNGGNVVGGSLNLGPLTSATGPNGTFPVVQPGFPSAAIDAGDSALAGTTDQLGTTRPQGAGVDIGAFERISGVPTASGPTGGYAAVTTAQAATAVYTFAVTYGDTTAMNYSSINGNSSAVTVTTPAGVAPVTVTFVSATPTSNAPTITATYQFTAPGGQWDPTDNGTYSVNMTANQVENTNNVYVPGSPPAIGTFTVAVPPPTAAAATHTISSAAESATYQFTVTYSDSAPIDYSTVNGNNNAATVTGSLAGGGTVNPPVTFVSATPNTNAATITATYQFTAPGGFWDATDNGAYTVNMAATQVKNVNGTYVPASPPAVGSFQVEVPRTITVTTTSDSGAGSLRDAVAQATADAPAADVIAFSNTTAGGATNFYDGAGHTIALTGGELVLNTSMTIAGPGPTALTVSGNNASRVFDSYVSGALTLGISGMHLTGGSAAGTVGGAINFQDATLTMSNVQIDDSAAYRGGGVSVSGTGSLVLVNSTVAANTTVNSGGAIFVVGIGNVVLTNSTLSGNSAGYSGGGVYFNHGGSLRATGSTISGNTAGGVNGVGGGVYWWGPVNANGFTLSNSTIANNQAGDAGGGVFLNNFATSAGGVLNVTSCTITGNSSATNGGGIADLSAGVINLRNTIIAGNTAVGSGPDIYTFTQVTSTYDAIGSSAGFAYTAGSGDLPVGSTLNLSALSNHGGPTATILPGAGSAAIDAGDPAQGGPGHTDQRGVARPQGAGVDIGSVETATPPQVGSVVVGDGPTADRSEVRKIVVTFDRAVSFTGGDANAAAAFQLLHVSSNGTPINALVNGMAAAVTTNASGQTVVTLTFGTAVSNPATETDPTSGQNGGQLSLADGQFKLTILSSNVSGPGGNLAGGGPGGNYVSPAYGSSGDTVRLYRVFGDATGDGQVDLNDLAAFRNALNSSTGGPNYLAYLDANNDGNIDLSDLTEFRNRLNHVV